MDEKLPDVLTIEEASHYLRIPMSSLYRLAQTGRVPCQKVGRHWRFHRQAIDHWLGKPPASAPAPKAESELNRGKYFCPKSVRMPRN